MWDALKQILRGSELYSKQFVMFVVVIAGASLVVGVYRYIWVSAPQAASDVSSNLVVDTDTGLADFAISVAQDARVTVNDRIAREAIVFEDGKPQLLVVLVRKSQVYISQLRAVVTLPAGVTAPEVQPRLFAVHGVGASQHRALDPSTVEFMAFDVSEGATVSIGMTFPADAFDEALIPKLEARVSRLPAEAWLAAGLSLPLVTLVLLAMLLMRRWLINYGVTTTLVVNRLPAGLPPGMVGALYRARIGSREITATLFDLADRGFVKIYHGPEGEISFIRGKDLYSPKADTLKPFEVFILHQIFDDSSVVASDSGIAVALDRSLFSSKVAMTMVNLYDALVTAGYYVSSPNRYFLRYQMTGMTLFLIATAGAVYGSFAFPEPAFILFGWLGMMLASLLVVGVTPGLPTRTAKGTEVLRQWMAFRNYLASRDPVADVQPSQFFDYLPYAIVLDCVDDWMSRWRNETIVLPHWLTAARAPHTADDYRHSLVAVIASLSKSLVAARPPDVA